MVNVEALKRRYGDGRRAVFGKGPGGLPVVDLKTDEAHARVCLHGAHVMEFGVADGPPVLWMSGASRFCEGEPIRGGIPVCWPWFGVHPSREDLPPHGFARRCMWDVAGVETGADRCTLRLFLESSSGTRAMWDREFELNLIVSVDRNLQVKLRARNKGADPVEATAALHTYLNVSDITDIRIEGLAGCPYLDTVGAGGRGVQEGPITIAAETDRVYQGTENDCVLRDPGFGRAIRVEKSGSRSTVLWNPWVAKSARMPDFGDTEYRSVVCIETANAYDDARTLAPGATHSLGTAISVES